MTFSLYQISNDYQLVLHEAFQTDEITLEQVDSLNKLQGDIEAKAVAIASFIKNLEAESNMIKTAIQDMGERKKRIDNKVEYLTGYLKHNLEGCSINEVTTSPYFKIKVKKNPPSVYINDETLIPNQYKVVKQIESIDKNSIKEAINNNIEVPGAILNQTTRLEIK